MFTHTTKDYQPLKNKKARAAFCDKLDSKLMSLNLGTNNIVESNDIMVSSLTETHETIPKEMEKALLVSR